MGSKRPDQRLWLTAAEVDRLGLFLKPEGNDLVMNGGGGLGGRGPAMGQWKRLSSWIPMYCEKPAGHEVSCEDIAAWLVANIADAPSITDEVASSGEGEIFFLVACLGGS